MTQQDLLARLILSFLLALGLSGALNIVDAFPSLRQHRKWHRLVLGVMFAGAVLIEIGTSSPTPSGFRIDGQLAIIGAAALVAGPWVALSTAGVAFIARGAIGGFGVTTAQSLLIVTTGLMLLGLQLRKRLYPQTSAPELDFLLISVCAGLGPLIATYSLVALGAAEIKDQTSLLWLATYQFLTAFSVSLIAVLHLQSVQDRSREARAAAEVQAVVQAVPDLLLLCDTHGTLLAVRTSSTHDAVSPCFTLTPGERLAALLPEDAAATLMTTTREAVDSGDVTISRVCVPHSQGGLFYGEVRAVRMNQRQALLVIRDISREVSSLETKQSAEDRLQLLAASIPDYMGIIEPDGTMSYLTPSCSRFSAIAEQGAHVSLPGWARRVDPASGSAVTQVIERMLANPAPSSEELDIRSSYILANPRKHYWIRLRFTSAVKDGMKTGQIIFHGRDITSTRELEGRALLAETATHNMTDGLLVTTADRKIVWANRGFESLSGFTEAEILSKEADAILNSFPVKVAEDRESSLKETGSWSGELLSQRSDSSWFAEWRVTRQFVNPVDGLPYYVNLIRDLSQERTQQETIYSLKNKDVTTGLPNKGYFLSLVKSRLTTDAPRQVIAVLELQNFSSITKSLGGSAGDKLLKLAAARIRNQLGEWTPLGRLEPNCFVFLVADTPNEAAKSVLQQVISQFNTAFNLSGKDVFLRPQVGAAWFPDDADSAETLLHRAQIALEGRSGRATDLLRFFIRDTGDAELRRLSLENALRQTLISDSSQLWLEYQPKVRLADNQVLGFEALCRWRHPELGSISPAEFIPLAEETGLIHFLGSWVFQQACQQLEAWRDAGFELKPIAVNLSVLQVHDEELPKQLLNVVRKHSLEPTMLELEVTESEIIEDVTKATQVLEQLRDEGFKISVDDFGTGHSSMAYLQLLPLDVLKLDGSFMRGLGSNRESEAIVQTLIAMANALSLETVAEGVETETQRDYLAQVGCQTIQGFLFSRPVSADAATQWLEVSTHLRGLPNNPS